MAKKNTNEMSFLDHLEDLRWLLIRCTLAIIIGAVVAFFFADFIFDNIIFGPKIMWSKIKSVKKKATTAPIIIAKVHRIKSHLKSSRWSKNDISLVFFFAILNYSFF